jgi:hypothetical protein
MKSFFFFMQMKIVNGRRPQVRWKQLSFAATSWNPAFQGGDGDVQCRIAVQWDFPGGTILSFGIMTPCYRQTILSIFWMKEKA